MKSNDQLEPTVFVIFGGAGDLTWRKLMPAMFDLSQDRSMLAYFSVIAVDRVDLRQEPMDDEADPSPLPLPARHWQAVMARRNGYIQRVDNAALLRLAREHETIVRMDRGIGEFVVQNTPLASLALENPPDQEIIAALRAAYSIDRNRTVHQDCAFGIRQQTKPTDQQPTNPSTHEE